ncbi:hypothetical protein K461DRAFT_311401 [Myriangium duriaei CBS 260.36]|uniref:Ornithine decarboxylase antizyme n=1 Tax=Myriangium duriaei CBS 260.36 TaxID=1168546 RepID=A0A9P4JA41_9PEZI|nr:hypothetical protein K461DRAFT_311401 [Myriangium duriaei CBS 260.36]
MSSNFVKKNSQRQNIQASAYAVDAVTGELKGMHYSTSGPGGMSDFGPGGGFEVSTGIPSPPLSPRRTAASSPPTSPMRPSMRSRGSTSSFGSSASSSSASAAYTITEECERLFCETLSAVFLGEGNLAEQDSLVMGAHEHSTKDIRKDSVFPRNTVPLPTPPSSLTNSEASVEVAPAVEAVSTSLVRDYVEIWSYASGLRFRGFVAEKDGERALFIFFEKEVIGKDLKKGLMALLELASVPDFDCTKLVACLDRNVDDVTEFDDLVRDLGWVGFEPTTLEPWHPGTVEVTSHRWFMLDMDV